MTDILSFDATAQLQALEGRRIAAFELLEACQNALNSRNIHYNAVVAADFERAQERARAIDDKRVRGDSLGALAGLPMTVKDSFDVEGLPASAGQEALRHRRASDGRAVSRIKTADAVIWGKTNVPPSDRDWQTAGGLFGTTNNPWDVTRTSGGSSGGAAAAVAARLTALELGSDSCGGLRAPASFCGVYAHRPTAGLVDSRGHVPPRPGAASEREMLCPGPVARSARDLRLMLSVISEASLPARVPPAELSGMKVGLWLEEPAFALDPEVRKVFEAFAGQLTAQGAQVQTISSPVEPRGLLGLFADLLAMSEADDLPFGDFLKAMLLRGPAWVARGLGQDGWSSAGRLLGHTATHRAWLMADEARARLRLAARTAFEACSVIVAPCAPVAAFAHQKAGLPLTLSNGRAVPYAALAHWNALASVCGMPATTAPIGATPGGLPVGAQIIGPRGADSRTLAAAQAIEEALGGFVAPAWPQGQPGDKTDA